MITKNKFVYVFAAIVVLIIVVSISYFYYSRTSTSTGSSDIISNRWLYQPPDPLYGTDSGRNLNLKEYQTGYEILKPNTLAISGIYMGKNSPNKNEFIIKVQEIGESPVERIAEFRDVPTKQVLTLKAEDGIIPRIQNWEIEKIEDIYKNLKPGDQIVITASFENDVASDAIADHNMVLKPITKIIYATYEN